VIDIGEDIRAKTAIMTKRTPLARFTRRFCQDEGLVPIRRAEV